MILVYFFGAHAFAWVAKKSVQVWNADVDVPGDKRPLLQRLALEEAYAWQKEVLTKPPTRRRNPEPVKPKQDSKSQDTLKNERIQLLTSLKAMYKQQTKDAKLEKLKARAAARGEELPEDFSVSSEEDDDTASRKSAGRDADDDDDENSHDDARSIASSSKSKSSKVSSAKSSSKGAAATPKSAEKLKKANSAVQSPSAAESPITVQSEESDNSESEDDDDKAQQGDDDDEEGSAEEPSAPDVPDLGADELTEIDLSSAIQRGKFILRARRTESMPPKKRKYTRRVPLASPGSTSHNSASNHAGDASEEEGAHESRSSKKSKKSAHKTPTKPSHASSSHPQRASARLASTEATNSAQAAKDREDSYLASASRDRDHPAKNASSEVNPEQDELEALKLANTIASRRKLRRSGHQATQEDEVLSLPLPTRQRAKHGTKEGGSSATHSDGQPSSSSPQPAPSSVLVTVDLSAEEAESEPVVSVRPNMAAPSSASTASSAQIVAPAPSFAVPNAIGANAKKTGRGKYVRKGKRDSNSDSPPEPLCASCAMARPNNSRHSLGLYMFYMLEDHIASQRNRTPRYRCVSHRCGQTFYTEAELKEHLKTHFERIQKLFSEPPTKKRKVTEEDESEANNSESNRNHSDKVATTSKSSKPTTSEDAQSSTEMKESEHLPSEGNASSSMDVDHPDPESSPEEADGSAVDKETAPEGSGLMDVDSAHSRNNGAHSDREPSQAILKEVIYYQCDFGGCTTSTDDEEDGAFFASLPELNAHITKVHCGGITHRACSRCGTKDVYSLAPVTTIAGRAARAKNAASVSSHYVNGRGRMLPFDPMQGIAPPNMISLPLQNLSYQPTPAPSQSPIGVLAAPQFVTAASAHAHMANLAQQQMHLPMGVVDPMMAPIPTNLSRITPHFAPQPMAAMQAGHILPNGHGLMQAQQAAQAQPFALMGAPLGEKPMSSSLGGNAADADDSESGDRPKRSTRIRRSSAAAQQMAATQHLTSPYGHLSSKQARAAAQEAREAVRAAKAMTASPTTLGGHGFGGNSFAGTAAVAHPPPAPAKHASPAANVPPKKKKGSIYSVSSPPPTTTAPIPARPPPATTPRGKNETVGPATAAATAAAAAGGAEMGALLDLINLCSSIVE